MMRRTVLLLFTLLEAACIVQTESVEGSQGPPGEPGAPGSDGVSPFAYTDSSMTDIYYAGGRVGVGDVSGGPPTPAAKLVFGKTIETTETGLPSISHGSILNEGVSNDIELATHSANGGVVFSTGAEAQAHVVIDSEGLIGIGTLLPAAPIHVYKPNSYADLFLESGSPEYGGVIRFLNSGVEQATIRSDIPLGTMRFETGGPAPQARMTITADGNVGVGTTSPTRKLEVAGGAAVGSLLVQGGSLPGLTIHNDNEGPWAFRIMNDTYGGAAFQMYQGNDGSAVIYNADNLVSVISSTGNVGIGTASPTTRLDVHGEPGGIAVTIGDAVPAHSIGIYGDSFYTCAGKPCTLPGQTGWLKVHIGTTSSDKFMPLFD